MKSGKGRKGQESRKRLLKAAANEFSLHGFHDTKVSTIVKRAGLTQPSFYLYFQSKDAIFGELITDFHSHLKKLTKSFRLEQGINQEDVSQRVLTAVETVFAFLAADPDLTRIGFFLNPDAKKVKSDLAMALKENLEAEQQLGYFRPELDMETVAECLIGMIEHLTDSYLLPGTRDPASLAMQVVDLLMQGMRPGQASE
ncbi:MULTISPECIES: TetR/AcrR family transcriptional regulator [Bacillus]|uniref:TetR/AcrR family transcriptional regulator n=1 Tax=Bacillus glycinifermentans TaxID=1664069 RepID=A0AAJ3YZ02_9BACI|nr:MULTISPECIES: TetR/AcrR family transcriptional regulator [Bacillus]KKB74669.1 TetR family transcriptional regulator [Bacillus sp. TH008]MBU8788428.1 TetR/AcrR family transcriptional regulator [Bacillus glycinifermentans]MDU0070981.1 TetR/AcrR family transcriptional regulator [Bacillus sp. IG6]MED8018848.1 TetR/AcrR family transcriptional regulator [Bacillus glycinifermentans]NUJ18594.1 TetR/AcrR family transcriptional regulator [Bacillus glycinifermentans]